MSERECGTCHGERIVEEPIYGRFAAEATRVVPCPRCSRPQYDDVERKLTQAIMVRRGSHRWLRLRDIEDGAA